MKLNGSGKAIGVGAVAALSAALITGVGVHMKYRGTILGEGERHGVTSAEIRGLDSRMDRHQVTCDQSIGGLRATNRQILRELGELNGTVDSIWRYIRGRDR